MKLIVTGATGMVGEGVLLAVLDREEVIEVLSISRKPSGINHPKLKEIIHSDFYDLSPIESQMKGYNAVLFCLGISSVGLSKEDYYKITYTLTLHFAEVYHRQNPEGKFCYISGRGTDSQEKGNGWASVKGKTENDLVKLFGQNAYNFRPAFIKPMMGFKRVNKYFKYVAWMYKPGRSLFPSGFTNTTEIANAMVNVVEKGYPKQILEGNDIILAAQP